MKIIATIVLTLFSSVLFAQEPLDAIRYSWTTPQGTARAQAIGGAVNALGGDITSLYTNPAGLGMYKTSELVLTPGFTFNNNKTSYRGSSATDSKSSFNYGPVGVVWGIPSSRANAKWKSFSVGLSINKTANFTDRVYATGDNNQSSFSEKYLEQLIKGNATNPNDAASNYPYGASLAFNTYLIDTLPNASGYFSNASVATGLKQQQTISSKGGVSDFSIGMGANYNDVFYIGASININTLNFTRTSTFGESDATDTVSNFNYFEAEDYLKTSGVGASVKIGIIFKPVDALRVGLTFHSPSWYSFKDTYSSSITTDTRGYAGVQSQSSLDLNDGYYGEYNYRYRTPMRLGAGLSYIFGTQGDVKAQKGFISADVEYVSYKNSSFNAQDKSNQDDKEYFNTLNNTIDKVFKSAMNFRVGGELKFETFMARAGFGYYGNPYTNEYFTKTPDEVKASRMSISGGLGWRNKGMFVDLTYIHQIVKDGYYPYRLDNPDLMDVVKVNSTVGNILLTVGFKF
jgi:hypothetical protein